MIKYFIFLLLSILVISCSKDDKNRQDEETENPADTSLSPQEKFSASILIDFLGDSNDDDLADYLETEVYRMGAGYKGASVMEISPAVWFVMLEKDTLSQNYILQKFINLKTNEYYFQLKATPLTLTDIITKGKTKTSAGDSLK